MRKNKQDITEIAMALFRQKGYDGVSMRDVALAVGLQKASLYSHFASKEDLIAAVICRSIDDLTSKMILTGNALDDFEQALTEIVAYLKETKKCIGLQLLYSLDLSCSPVIKENIVNFFQSLKHGLIKILMQDSKFKNIDTESMIEDIISQIEGATIWLALENNVAPLERSVSFGMRIIKSMAINNK